MAINFTEAKRAKKEEYERLCRTPGTPQHQARQDRLNQRTRELQREQDKQRLGERQARAAQALADQRRVISASITQH